MDIEAKISYPSSAAQQMRLFGASPQLDAGDAIQVALQLYARDVQVYQRQGNDLVLVLNSGERIVLKGFFRINAEEPELLLLDDNGEYCVRVSFPDDQPGILEPFIATCSEAGAAIWPYALGAVALGAVGLAVGNDDDDGGDRNVVLPVPTLTIFPTDGKTISGTATPGATVALDIDGDGKPDLFTVADRQGNWSVDPESDLPDGREVTGWATRHGITVGPVIVIVDVGFIPNPPVVTTISDDSGAPGDGITNDNTLVFSGTAEPNATVEVFLNGDPIGTTTAGPDGKWTFDHSDTPLPDGPYEVTTRQTDAQGNGPSELSPGFQVIVDTTPPPPPVVTAISEDSGASATDGITNDNTLVFSGTAEPNATVEVFLNGSPIGTTTADPNGNWTFDHTGTPLPDGTHEVTSRQTTTDAAGNGPSVLSNPFNVTVDTMAEVTIEGMLNDFNTNADFATFTDSAVVTGKTIDPGATVAILVNGVALGSVTADSQGVWQSMPIDLSGLGVGGTLSVEAQVTDIAGNTGSATQTITREAPAARTDIDTSLSDINNLSPATGFIIQGDVAGDGLGRSVSSAGDVNGDGIADLIVGAWEGDDGGTDAGEAYVIFGKASGIWGSVDPVTGRQVLDTTNLAPADGFIIQGDAAGDALGRSVSSAGDVNGDGIDDLIVGSWAGDDGGTDAGEAYVVFGKAGGGWGSVDGTGRQVLDLTNLAVADGLIIQGDAAGDRLGTSISSAGDINGDGIADLIVGVEAGDDGGNGAGEAYVVFGKNGGGWGTNVGGRQVLDMSNLAPADGFIIQGDAADDNLGVSVSSAGDINGDGIGDLIVGAENGDDGGSDAGEAYVVFGKAGGAWGSVDGSGRQVLDTTNLAPADGFIIQGDVGGDQLGFSVSSAGDINNDGFADLIVGAPNSSGGGVGAGEAYVIFGKAGGWGGVDGTGRQVLDTSSLAPADGFIIQGDTFVDTLGYSVSSAGDINGDGFADLIVGARGGDDGGGEAGEAYVIFGKAGGGWGSVDGTGRQVLDTTNLAPTDGFLIQGDVALDLLGTSVSAAGDINNDGIDDLIVGASEGDDGGTGAGEAYVIFGSTTFGGIVQSGTAGADWLTGSDAGDQLIGLGGADTLLSGAGRDILTVSDTGFARIDGGAGEDTLVLAGGGIALDFTAIASGVVTGIEAIDITGSGNNTLTLTAQDVLELSDTDILRVNGDAGDSVTASGFSDSGTDQTIGDATYDVYTSGSATLWVDQAVSVV